MADYDVVEVIGGKWAKASELSAVKRAKIVSEVKPSPSQFKDLKTGEVKMQDVGKVQFEGITEPMNVNFNKATINGLVKAFGKKSTEWVNKVVTVETEKMRVAGKAVTALYLIPEGFERVDDSEGYARIQRIGGETEQPAPADDIPLINLDDDGSETGGIKIQDVPF
jgi:hypothetical protein